MADSLLGGKRGSAGEYPEVAAGNHLGRWALVVAAAGALFFSGRHLRRLEVEGNSMLPTLAAGDRVLIWAGCRPRPGDVVALSTPAGRLVIKRVSAADRGRFTVLGDNLASSTDSRHFGNVERTAIVGRVVWRYWPEDRRGRLPLSDETADKVDRP